MITYNNDKKADAANVPAALDHAQTASQLVKSADNRPETLQHTQVNYSVANSSLMTAQKKSIQRILGPVQKAALKEEEIQKKSINTHQLQSPHEEELVQKKTADIPSSSAFMPIQKKENNTGLPDNLKSGVENLSGMSLDHVKVHYGSDKPAQLNALAYAQGSDIHVASGQEKHLPHEAWHVVQQMQGRVQPTVQMEGVAVNDDAALENEADVMGAKALSN